MTGPPTAAAVGIPVFHGLHFGRWIEKTSGVKRSVLNVFIRAAVPLVGPALGDHVNRGEAAAILRGSHWLN